MQKNISKKVFFVILFTCFETLAITSLIYISNYFDLIPNFKSLPIQLIMTILYNIFIISPRILIFFFFYFYLKKDFTKEIMLKICENPARKVFFFMLVIYSSFIIFALFTYSDSIEVWWNAFYFLFLIALPEELFFRGILPYLLRDCKTYIIYFVPSLLFAFSHIFAISGFGKITLHTLYLFFTIYFLQYIVFSYLMEWLKRVSKTIWTPILFHAIMDFFVLFCIGYEF